MAVVTSAVLIAACGSSSGSSGAAAAGDKPFAGQTLIFGGGQADANESIMGAMAAKFKEETGADVQFIGGSAPDNLSKLLAAKGRSTPPFDAVFLDSTTQPAAAQAGLIQQVDYKTALQSYSQFPGTGFPTQGYGPGYFLIRLGTCYNTEVYKQLGLNPPTSLDDWFDPKLQGRVALPDTTNFYWGAAMPAIAKNYNIPLDDPAALMSKFRDIHAQTLFTSSSDAQQRLQTGQVAMTTLTDGRCLALKLAGQPVDLAPVNVVADGKTYPYINFVDTVDIVTGSPKTELAKKFIDMYTSSTALMPYIQKTGYVPARQDVYAEAKQDPKLAPYYGAFDSATDLYTPDMTAFLAHQAAWIDAWNNNVKQGG
ncbi:MAG: hypothetical protein ABS81_04145 [Pseudonocardia sp. SCN 72-86]|nr:MAG: hypothetical protein ABS81_04145 [Pseudonocardia sp. SCN 72-86]